MRHPTQKCQKLQLIEVADQKYAERDDKYQKQVQYGPNSFTAKYRIECNHWEACRYFCCVRKVPGGHTNCWPIKS